MATIPTPPTFVAGEIPTAVKLNTIRDCINFWALTPRAYAYCTSLTLATSGTAQVVPLQAEVYDTDTPAMHDNATNNSRLIAQTAGKYQMTGQVTFGSSATGDRQTMIRKNSGGSVAGGTLVVLGRMTSTATGALPLPTPPVELDLAAGDYIEMFALQASGASLAVTTTDQANTWMQMRLVGT